MTVRLLISCVLITGWFVQGITALPMDVWTRSAYINVFQDEAKPAAYSDTIGLVVAKNEYEGAQILLRSDSGFTIQGVLFSDLACGPDTLGKASLSFNYVDYHYLTHNSAGTVVRSAPAWFPDALSNDSIRTVTANSTQPVWIRAYIPEATKSGTYTGLATIRTTAGDYPVNLSIEVCDIAIPDGKDGGFNTEFWFFTQFIPAKYGYTPYSLQWWSLVDIWAQSFRDYRMNTIWVPFHQLLLDGGTTLDSSGHYTLNWTLFDRFVRTFINQDCVKRLAGGHLGGRMSDWSSDIGITVLKKTGDTMGTAMLPLGTTEVDGWLSQFLPALSAHLQDSGWYGLWYQHIADEPSTSQHAQAMGMVADSIRKYCPAMPVGDAVYEGSPFSSLLGTVDVWTFKTQTYESNASFFNARKSAGEEIWLYSCCGPKGPLNRFIDYPVWQMRSLGWLCYRYGLDGFLHWGWNYWNVPVEQQQYCEGYSPGDGNTVYPDSVRGTIKGSIRYEAWRDAAEEYELFRILEARNPQRSQTLAGRVVTSGSNYESDPDTLLLKRNELIRAAADTTPYVPEPVQLALNGGFNGTSPWVLYTDSDASAAFAIDNGAGRVAISQGGAYTWSIQLFQQGIFMTPGKTYRLSFKARASAPRTLRATIHLHNNPFTDYYSETIGLDTALQDFGEYVFVYNGAAGAEYRISFQPGTDTHSIWIDDVLLLEDQATHLETAFPTPMLFTASPNPLNSAALFSYDLGAQRAGQLAIFRPDGRCVARFALSEKRGQVRWDGQGTASGVYLCRLTVGRKGSLIRKIVLTK